MPASIVLSFDPYVSLAGLIVPLRALVIAAAILIALLVAALVARRLPLVAVDDLLYVAIGVIPGAVVGGRVVYGLAHIDYYASDPGALLDPAKGSASLLGAILGGTLTGAVVARLFGAPIRTWLDAAALPMLVLVAVGKVGEFVAGAGQGVRSDAQWAVAFAGPGPWLSVSPNLPAHPSQLYEGAWALLGVPLVLGLMERGRERPDAALRPGYAFVVALAWWLLGRVAAGFTWRDEQRVDHSAANRRSR